MTHAAAPLPPDETRRLQALQRYGILDSLPEQVFDDIVVLASEICNTPVGLVSFIDQDRQWFKARVGVNVAQTPRDQAFCAHAILAPNEVLVVPDALLDKRFHDNPLVQDGPLIRFYAGAPVVTPEGHPLGTVCVIDTVARTLSAEQQQALQALARQAAALLQLRELALSQQAQARELHQKVTDALADGERRHDGLRQRQRVAAVGQLTSGIAHDFNNLLQTINGSLQLMQRRAGNAAEIQRLALGGLHAVAQGAKLTAQLLAFSRTEAPRSALIAPDALIAPMHELLARALGTEIQLVFDLQAAEATVRGDAMQLEAAVLNLAINARDAMSGVGRIAIETRATTLNGDSALEDGLYVELRVVDNGPGMLPAVARRAFEPFFTTKESGKGTGLGLAQVYGFAAKAGGAARIRSAPGSGTDVVLWLKTATGTADDTMPPTPEAGAQPMHHETTILLVDDDTDLRSILGELLTDAGYRVTAVDSSLAALAAVEQQVPDIALVDCAMPSINGAGLARMLHVLHPGLPVIFITGYADTDALRPALGDGAVVLQKPLLLEDVVAAVQNALVRSA